MKTEDLMIGDWVMNTKNEPVKVKNLGFGYVNMETKSNVIIYSTHDFCVEPIPLTKEILEKNKFPYAPKADGYFVGDLFLRGDDNIGYCVGANIRIDNGDGIVSGMYYTFGKICYIHELQHLLKFCGIEKEVVL